MVATETMIERRIKRKQTDRLDDLKSTMTLHFQLERQAMEQVAALNALWLDTLPDLEINARRLAQMSSGVQLFTKDVKMLAERYQSAMSVLVLFAEKMDENSADITDSVQALMHAKDEPAEILEKIETSVQEIIGLTLQIALLDEERQDDPQYLRRVITRALPTTLVLALKDMTPYQRKYLADMLLPLLADVPAAAGNW